MLTAATRPPPVCIMWFAPAGQVTVRVNTGALSFRTTADEPFDLLAAVASLKRTGAVGAWSVETIANGDATVKGRVCAIRKTREAVEMAHEKIRREAVRKGKQVQPQTLEFARYVIVFTTFSEDSFAAREILEWYRVRWQVELVFKRFKSLAQLGHLPKYDDESARAWLYGKLLVALLVEKLIHHACAIFPLGIRPGGGDAHTARGVSSSSSIIRSRELSSLRCHWPN